MQEKHPWALKTARVLSADRGYDATALVESLWDDYRITPIIDIRNMWKDGAATRLLPGYATVPYNYRGDVFGPPPDTGAAHPMAHGGFEADRDALKKRWPAQFSGVTCDAQASCPVAQGIRIPWSRDRRILTPIDRSSYTWKREYAHRTAVERVHSRLDVSFGCELHTIRGMAKMRARCGRALLVMLGRALLVMLGRALGRIRQQHPELLRSLDRSA
jgi:hypothetical protein